MEMGEWLSAGGRAGPPPGRRSLCGKEQASGPAHPSPRLGECCPSCFKLVHRNTPAGTRLPVPFQLLGNNDSKQAGCGPPLERCGLLGAADWPNGREGTGFRGPGWPGCQGSGWPCRCRLGGVNHQATRTAPPRRPHPTSAEWMSHSAKRAAWNQTNPICPEEDAWGRDTAPTPSGLPADECRAHVCPHVHAHTQSRQPGAQLLESGRRRDGEAQLKFLPKPANSPQSSWAEPS